jgi:hypothetical protein
MAHRAMVEIFNLSIWFPVTTSQHRPCSKHHLMFYCHKYYSSPSNSHCTVTCLVITQQWQLYCHLFNDCCLTPSVYVTKYIYIYIYIYHSTTHSLLLHMKMESAESSKTLESSLPVTQHNLHCCENHKSQTVACNLFHIHQHSLCVYIYILKK